MLLKGDVTIHAPRKKVWDFMTDPNQIGPCALDVQISGQLVSLASCLMVPVSRKLAGVFYDEVHKRIEMENAQA